MKEDIRKLEKDFYIKRDSILKELESKEIVIRKKLKGLLFQAASLKKRQNQLKNLDDSAKKKLYMNQSKLDNTRKKVKTDEESIECMRDSIDKLKKEIPVLERTIQKIIPQRDSIFEKKVELDSMLKKLNKNIFENQSVINILKSKIKNLDSKESFVKQARIVWNEMKARKNKKARRPVKAEKKNVEEKPKKKSFFGIFSR